MKRVKHEVMIIADYAQDSSFTLEELCEICRTSPGVIQDLITYEIVHPKQSKQHQWIFDLAQVQRAKTALRLRRDLGVNLSGIMLILDLLDEVKDLREKNEILQRYFV